MHTDKLVKRTLTTHTPDDTPIDFADNVMRDRRLHRLPIVDEAGRPVVMLALADLYEVDQLAAANTPTRPAPRRSDPDFTWLLAEASIPCTIDDNLWGR